MTDLHHRTAQVKAAARFFGFDYCGIAQAQKLDEDARRLESWLNHGYQGKMAYMDRYFDLRIDPARLVPGARSVITLLLNHYPAVRQDEAAPRIAKYAYGKDYHEVIRGKLTAFLEKLREDIGPIDGRGFTDSAPVLERSWAVKSGLGWVGKNGNLITRREGSFFFIATLITDLELVADDPFSQDYCGTCTRCIDHCPTEAILPGKVVDGSKCISYFTIELRDALIPESMKGRFDNHLFGCDVCQDVCPWNRFARPGTEPAFEPLPAVLHFSEKDWQELTEESFRAIFRESPIKRSRFSGIKRNLKFLEDPAGDEGHDNTGAPVPGSKSG